MRLLAALVLVLASAPATAHAPSDWTPAPGYRVSLQSYSPASAFHLAMRGEYSVPDGSIVGWTDAGDELLFQRSFRDGTTRDVVRVPWVTASCSLRSANGGPSFDVDPAQGSVLIECRGNVSQVWRIDGFTSCPCPSLGPALSAVLDADDLPHPMAGVTFEGDGLLVGDGNLSLVYEEPASERHWTSSGLNVDGCDPLACDEDRLGGRCVEPVGDTAITFRCDGFHWAELPPAEPIRADDIGGFLSLNAGGEFVLVFE